MTSPLLNDCFKNLQSMRVSSDHINEAKKLKLIRLASVALLVATAVLTVLCLTSSPLVALTFGVLGIVSSLLIYDFTLLLKNSEQVLENVVANIGLRALTTRKEQLAFLTRDTILLNPLVMLTTK